MIIKFLKNSSSSLVDYKKYLNLPKNKREIIFYAEKESDFVFFKDIIYDLTLNKNIEVTYITSDPNDSILKKKIKNLKEKKLDLLIFSILYISFLGAFIAYIIGID